MSKLSELLKKVDGNWKMGHITELADLAGALEDELEEARKDLKDYEKIQDSHIKKHTWLQAKVKDRDEWRKNTKDVYIKWIKAEAELSKVRGDLKMSIENLAHHKESRKKAEAAAERLRGELKEADEYGNDLHLHSIVITDRLERAEKKVKASVARLLIAREALVHYRKVFVESMAEYVGWGEDEYGKEILGKLDSALTATESDAEKWLEGKVFEAKREVWSFIAESIRVGKNLSVEYAKARIKALAQSPEAKAGEGEV